MNDKCAIFALCLCKLSLLAKMNNKNITDNLFEGSEKGVEIRRVFNPLMGDFKENSYEIDFVEKGSVSIYYGIGIKNLPAGSWALVDSNKSLWLRPQAHEHPSILQIRASKKLFSAEFLSLPQCKPLASLLQSVAQGVCALDAKSYGRFHAFAEELYNLWDVERLLCAVRLFDGLSRESGLQFIAPLQPFGKGGSEVDTIVSKVNQYMEEHLAEPIKLQDLARIAGLTITSFSRFYKRRTGTAAIVRLDALRLSKACEMLEQTDLTFKEIAYRLGYNDSQFFSQYFRRKIGLTPIQFRRRRD